MSVHLEQRIITPPPRDAIQNPAVQIHLEATPTQETGWPPKQGVIYELPLHSPLPHETQILPETNSHETIYTNSLQRKVVEEWVPVREKIPSSTIHEVLREKSLQLQLRFLEMTPDQLNGEIDESTKEELMKLMKYSVIGTIDFMTAKKRDVDLDMLTTLLKMEEKYDPRKVAELRHYGSPENPGRMSIREAMRYLKEHFVVSEDGKSGHQIYELRGLPLPEDEIKAQNVSYGEFSDLDQRAIDRWQVNAFGKDINQAHVIGNMLGENRELMLEFEGMTSAQIDALSGEDIDRIAYEGTDFIIGVLGVFSIWGKDFKQEYDAAVEYIKEKYAAAEKLSKRHNVPQIEVFEAIKKTASRAKRNMQPPAIAAVLNLVR